MYSPSLEEFLELSKGGNLVPVTRKLLADLETPLSAYLKIRGQGESFLLSRLKEANIWVDILLSGAIREELSAKLGLKLNTSKTARCWNDLECVPGTQITPVRRLGRIGSG